MLPLIAQGRDDPAAVTIASHGNAGAAGTCGSDPIQGRVIYIDPEAFSFSVNVASPRNVLYLGPRNVSELAILATRMRSHLNLHGARTIAVLDFAATVGGLLVRNPVAASASFLAYASSHCVRVREQAYNKLVEMAVAAGTESSNVRDYMTEKLLVAFASGAVPVYWGSGGAVFEIFDNRTFLYIDPADPRPTFQRMQSLNKNYSAFKYMASLPVFREGAVDRYFSLFPSYPLGGSGGLGLAATVLVHFSVLRRMDSQGGAELCGLDSQDDEAEAEAAARASKSAAGLRVSLAFLELPKDCLVYSVGSNGESSFELAVKKRWPACEVYTMDPTLNAVRREKAAVLEAAGHLKVVDIGLAGANGTITLGGRQFPVLTLESHVEMLGHRNRRIDVLKVDIEGYEYEAFASLQPGLLDKVDQLQIELHGSSDEKIDSLIAAVHAAGFLMFNKEPNVLGYLLGGACEEFSFIGAAHAFHSFRASHPSCR
ncbi:hypothetical protein EMIHUDRAFT_202429 [Emiliania huxleyi CCMP1516]|uniref:Fucosyltransferase n=2 Tax=Emiliania huxleyi TaxID=2903 RepID=A0A0D3KBR3_EMIH1|nr:hypothetical protein EMIHUDRAFT_202429 [Emiliania huxleyi CCMP1516]EOD33198.1 hypothetical protein EMIHUDRAFT_202429 [Emiliania huxleyi CCMP1516]|eukprot:XP_005785627.1 hypothetical protein EMIHUDRAFT_202429 [Emiliania huxleyi CCMP1516]